MDGGREADAGTRERLVFLPGRGRLSKRTLALSWVWRKEIPRRRGAAPGGEGVSFPWKPTLGP